MGAGGAAPPVKSEDVMILIGSTILLTLLVIQAWSTPIAVECDGEECETFEIKYDLSEGDTFSLNVIEGEIRPTIILPDGSSDFDDNQKGNWEYEAKSDGVHTFQILGLEDSSSASNASSSTSFVILFKMPKASTNAPTG